MEKHVIQQMVRLVQGLCSYKHLTPGDLCLFPGAINMYMTIRGNESFFQESGSHAATPIYGKTCQKYSSSPDPKGIWP